MTTPRTLVMEQQGRTVKAPPKATAFAELADSLVREAAVIDELRAALLRQRAGVAAGAADDVRASCDDIGRVLATLEAARDRRANAARGLTGDPNTPLSMLAAAGSLPAPVAAAIVTLRHSAQAAAADTAINHVVLRRAIETGEAFLQALFSTAMEPDPVYHTGERRDEPGAGFLLDRKA